MESKHEGVSRRSFLLQASTTALLVPTGIISVSMLSGCGSGNVIAADESALKWKTTIVSDKEPGEPLIVSGTIYALDGKTPLEAAKLWVYQTDVTGIYSPVSGNGINRYTRIHGQIKTQSDGRYEFRTIKPASYPSSTVPAHIHVSLSAPNFQEYWIDNYLFEGDPFITADVRRNSHGDGRFASILKLTRGSDGVLRGVRDIQIERCTNRCA